MNSPVGVTTPQQRGAFTVSEGGITWTCSRCDASNPLDAPVCSVCGATFADSMRPPKQRHERDPNSVAMYSLFFPGAGHWSLGLKGAAIARGVLSTWVVAVAVLAGVAGSMLMAVVFGIVAFVLWAVAAHDAYREARHEERAVILHSRMFVYVVLSLLFLMGMMLVMAFLGASR